MYNLMLYLVLWGEHLETQLETTLCKFNPNPIKSLQAKTWERKWSSTKRNDTVVQCSFLEITQTSMFQVSATENIFRKDLMGFRIKKKKMRETKGEAWFLKQYIKKQLQV